jgi:hypothetical protein
LKIDLVEAKGRNQLKNSHVVLKIEQLKKTRNDFSFVSFQLGKSQNVLIHQKYL